MSSQPRRVGASQGHCDAAIHPNRAEDSTGRPTSTLLQIPSNWAGMSLLARPPYHLDVSQRDRGGSDNTSLERAQTRTHRPKQNQEHFRENFFASCHHSTAQTNDLLSDHRGWDSASSLRGRSVFTRAAAAAVATSRDAQDPLQQIADTEAAAAVVTADATLFRYLRIDSIVWRWTLASGWSFWR